MLKKINWLITFPNISDKLISRKKKLKIITDDINISIATGISETATKVGISIYPNPTEGVLNLRVKNFDNTTVRVFNLLGAQVYNQLLTSMDSQISLNNLENGMYIVKIEGNGVNYSEKITLTK